VKRLVASSASRATVVLLARISKSSCPHEAL